MRAPPQDVSNLRGVLQGRRENSQKQFLETWHSGGAQRMVTLEAKPEGFLKSNKLSMDLLDQG